MSLPTIKIDTLAIAKELENAGIPIRQAEAQTRVYVKVINTLLEDQLAAKQDILDVKQDIIGVDHDVMGVKEDLLGVKQDVLAVKQDVLAVKEDVVAVKQDVLAVDQNLSKRIDQLEKVTLGLKDQMKEQFFKLTLQLGGLVVTGITVLGVLIKL